jgi:hypothetical protein
MSTGKAWLQKYRTDVQASRQQGAGLLYVTNPTQDNASVAKPYRNHFSSTRSTATNFPTQKHMVTLSLTA